jgi:hypothetical protein
VQEWNWPESILYSLGQPAGRDSLINKTARSKAVFIYQHHANHDADTYTTIVLWFFRLRYRSLGF